MSPISDPNKTILSRLSRYHEEHEKFDVGFDAEFGSEVVNLYCMTGIAETVSRHWGRTYHRRALDPLGKTYSLTEKKRREDL